MRLLQQLGRLCVRIPFLSAVTGCSDRNPQTLLANYPGSFQIKEISSEEVDEGMKTTWLATVNRDNKVAKFWIELLLITPHGDSHFSFGRGAIMREPESDGSLFLAELSKVLEASHIPKQVEPLDRLDFNTALLGTSLSREPGPDIVAGFFSSDPPGTWIAVKVFVADGEGEFYLNLDSVGSVGEITLKDSDYGDIVLQELAKVLLPTNGD